MELNDNDRQRIRNEATKLPYGGGSEYAAARKAGFRAGAEYEHKYQLEQQAELRELLKRVFNGNGNITFDGDVLDKIAHIVNSEDKWNYHKK